MTAPDAPIELAPSDPAWPERFAAEAARLQPVLAPWLAGAIEHIGSTAVPGLVAKPVIDLMAPVVSLAASRDAIDAVVRAGYVHHPYRADVMHWFCRPSPAHRTHHLHLVPLGSPTWLERLAFRDALRTDPARAADYARLKQDLARRHRDDREAYTDGKSAFVDALLARASRGDSGHGGGA